MELRHLISFKQIAQCKSYSKAAKQLFLSQPTVTSHIQELEQELEVRLFYRDHSPVQLTEPGMIFLEYTDQILSLVRQATSEMANYKSGTNGMLDLSVSESAFQWLVTHLNRFNAAHPNIKINLQINLSHITLEKLARAEVHLGIVKASEPYITDQNLAYHVLNEDEGIAVFSKNCSLCKYKEIPLEALQNPHLQKVIFGRGTDFAKQVTDILDSAGIRHATAIEISNSDAIKLFIQRAECIVFLPAGLVQNELSQHLLETRTIKNFPRLRRYALLAYRKDLPLTPASRRFIQYLFKALDMPAPDLPQP